MNFIAANILFHADEFMTFWLLISLFDKLLLADLYSKSNFSKN